ncbi:MAG: nitroreductase [Bacteroidota bacterium]
MSISPAQATELIRKRRAIFPKTFNDKPLAREIIEEVLENANWAPTHRLTQPWRFKVFTGKALERLANYLSEFYRNSTPAEQFLETKYAKMKENPRRSACTIAICMQRDPQERVPEWEELAAVACAVENMWLTCTAYNLGCYWSTPPAAVEGNEFFDLAEGELCLGLFYMGWHDLEEMPATPRSPVSEKVVWMEA